MSGSQHIKVPVQLCVVQVLITSVWTTSAITTDDFYPFGRENGDSQLNKTDDEDNESVLDVNFTSSFEFFGKHYTSISVLTNGLLSLNRSDISSNFSPKRFPTSGSTLIAPFWADADTRGIGRVYYRSTVNETLLEKMTQDINKTFNKVFFPEYLFISTWHKVGYFNRKTDKTNTFQCVLATDHTISFILFLYEKGGIQWAKGDQISSNSNAGYATVGFNVGDGQNYETLPGSNTANVINVANTSNVGITGMWAFQVNIAGPDPCSSNPCDINANCTQSGVSGDFTCTCVPPYSGNGKNCTALTNGTSTEDAMDNTTTDTTESQTAPPITTEMLQTETLTHTETQTPQTTTEDAMDIYSTTTHITEVQTSPTTTKIPQTETLSHMHTEIQTPQTTTEDAMESTTTHITEVQTSPTTTKIPQTETQTHTEIQTPQTTTDLKMLHSDSTTSVITNSLHMEPNTKVIISMLVLVGILLLITLPGAVYGYVKISRSIVSYEIKTFKDPATSTVDAKYIIIGNK